MKQYQLNRSTKQRKALFKSLVVALIERESIETTNAKARAVRSIFEKLLTHARTGTLHARRQVQAFVQSAELVHKLVDSIAPRYKSVKGGYTTLKVVGNRRGDNAPIVRLSLTKKSEKLVAKSSAATTRSAKSEEGQKATTQAAKVAPAIKAQSIKAPKTPVAKAAGRIGVRQGER